MVKQVVKKKKKFWVHVPNFGFIDVFSYCYKWCVSLEDGCTDIED